MRSTIRKSPAKPKRAIGPTRPAPFEIEQKNRTPTRARPRDEEKQEGQEEVPQELIDRYLKVKQELEERRKVRDELLALKQELINRAARESAESTEVAVVAEPTEPVEEEEKKEE